MMMLTQASPHLFLPSYSRPNPLNTSSHLSSFSLLLHSFFLTSFSLLYRVTLLLLTYILFVCYCRIIYVKITHTIYKKNNHKLQHNSTIIIYLATSNIILYDGAFLFASLHGFLWLASSGIISTSPFSCIHLIRVAIFALQNAYPHQLFWLYVEYTYK